MKKLILDYSKWRCGGSGGENKLGRGITAMYNEKGFMCCLGQFSLQIEPSLHPTDITEGEPFEIKKYVSGLNQFFHDDDHDFRFINTFLSDSAITINDNPETTPETKIELLKTLFGKHGYEIEVINK